MDWRDKIGCETSVNVNGNIRKVYFFGDGTGSSQGCFSAGELRAHPIKMFALDYGKVLFEESFLREFKNWIDWSSVDIGQKISIDYIREFLKNVPIDMKELFFNFCSSKLPVTEQFVEEFAKQLNWHKLMQYHNFSEQFIEKHLDRINWTSLCQYQHLSEDFMRKYADKVNWSIIITFQDLSEPFIKEMSKYITKYQLWNDVALYQDVSINLLKRHKVENLVNFWKDRPKVGKIEMDKETYEDKMKHFSSYGLMVLK